MKTIHLHYVHLFVFLIKQHVHDCKYSKPNELLQKYRGLNPKVKKSCAW